MFKAEIIQQFNRRETPFYHYDLGLFRQTLAEVKNLAKKFQFEIHYAVKANSNPIILQEVLKQEFGADCVSGNEVQLAVENKFCPRKIFFAGVGKTDKEIRYALSQNIKAFNCESIQEIEVINELAKASKKIAEIALRINPNVDAKTHKHITTGLDENKFGINQIDLPELVEKLAAFKQIKLTGLHFHIGSQITDMNVFKGLCIRVNQIANWFENHGISIKHFNMGGGLGVDYLQPDANKITDFKSYFSIFDEFLKRNQGQHVHFELGRSLVAQCGSLISRVTFIKKGLNTHFAILDAGMTELMRPALYQSYHQIDNLSNGTSKSKRLKNDNKPHQYDVVGPICESTDCFGKSVELGKTERGDLIAIRSAGAYGEVMVSNYNLRDRHDAFYTD